MVSIGAGEGVEFMELVDGAKWTEDVKGARSVCWFMFDAQLARGDV